MVGALATVYQLNFLQHNKTFIKTTTKNELIDIKRNNGKFYTSKGSCTEQRQRLILRANFFQDMLYLFLHVV